MSLIISVPVVARERVTPLRDVLVLVSEQGAGDVWRVAAALDVDKQGGVVHGLVLELVKPSQVDPVLNRDLIDLGTIDPRLECVDDSNLEQVKPMTIVQGKNAFFIFVFREQFEAERSAYLSKPRSSGFKDFFHSYFALENWTIFNLFSLLFCFLLQLTANKNDE